MGDHFLPSYQPAGTGTGTKNNKIKGTTFCIFKVFKRNFFNIFSVFPKRDVQLGHIFQDQSRNC